MKNYKYHILYWSFVYVTHCILHFGTFSTKIYWYSFLTIYIHQFGYIIIFYVLLFYIIPQKWNKEKYFQSILITLLLITSTFLLKAFIFSVVPSPEGDKDSSDFSASMIISFEIGQISMFLPFVFAFYYAEKITQQQQAKAQIEQENFKLEQSIIDTQLNNLKNQINPDFLFRKLDYFYQESLPHSASLSKGISLLSDMMHYAIGDDDEEGKVPLEKEITHIRNFIEINQLRFDGRLQVDFEVLGEVGSLKIMPLILITFVENAFKYGELMDAENPLKIQLKLTDNQLFFSTYNRTRRGPKEQSEGIGMANTQKRLALAYPDQHRLDIKSEIDFYEVALEMKL
jgi:two-component system, LytTR family, sensor kinase